ncbi:MAG: type IX secretion system membrane protein PorP/SprF [Bacteroidetes bacterium]|nr:type IX secretion system membrane protein PorP/SprF [Bacteroidota bacterium]
MIRTLTRVLAAAAVLAPLAASAQQDPYYTHFTYNKVLLNPAYAGASGSFCINAITHQQWRSFEDQTHAYKTQSQGTSLLSDNLPANIAPKTSGFAFYAPINIKNKTTEEIKNYGGAYIGFVSDVVAYETNTYLRGGVAGAYTLSDGSDIRLGVDFVSLTKQLDGDKLRAHDPNDPKIPTGKPGDTKTTFGAGLFYHNPNFHELYVGLSTSHLKPQTFSYGTSGAINISTARHFYLMAGGRWENFLANPSLTLDPAILIKTVNEKGGFVKPQVDLQGMVTWNQLYAGGANFRFNAFGVDALSLMLGYYPPIKGNDPGPNGKNLLRVGYSYDITLQSLRRASNGTHELQVNYCFRITLPERIEPVYRHPRYMQRPENIE